MRVLINDVISWGYRKGILRESFTDEEEKTKVKKAQLMKTREEVAELHTAISMNDKEEVIDAIGDIIVTLTMQADLWDVDIEDCLQAAYDVISKRKGKMVDGQFVKDTMQ